MNKNYYTEYYKYEREHWFFLARNKILMGYLKRRLDPNRSYNILNIGVATGRTSELLSQFGNVKSIEYDEECFEFTKSKIKDIDIERGSITELRFEDNSYDLVCAFDVIEHVKDDQLAVQEMKRVCKYDGNVFVTVPAFMFLWSEHDVVNMHERRYKKSELVHLFKKSGNTLFTSFFNFWLFTPIFLYRCMISKILPEKKEGDAVGKDFQVTGNNKFVNNILLKLFSSENFFVKRNLSLPIGVSLLIFWKK